MGKKYKLVTDEQRQLLIHLIHTQELSITAAARQVGIVYPTAKAINNVFLTQNRILKKKAGFNIHAQSLAGATGNSKKYGQRKKLSLKAMKRAMSSSVKIIVRKPSQPRPRRQSQVTTGKSSSSTIMTCQRQSKRLGLRNGASYLAINSSYTPTNGSAQKTNLDSN